MRVAYCDSQAKSMEALMNREYDLASLKRKQDLHYRKYVKYKAQMNVYVKAEKELVEVMDLLNQRIDKVISNYSEDERHVFWDYMIWQKSLYWCCNTYHINYRSAMKIAEQVWHDLDNSLNEDGSVV